MPEVSTRATPAAGAAAPSAGGVISSYLSQLHQAMTAIPARDLEAAAKLLRSARQREATIFFCGNGGSASTASHFALDLGKNTINPRYPRFRTVALTDNAGMVTAWGNDEGYDQVFVQQARNLMRPHDVLVAISGSGNSPNVLLAAEHARSMGCQVIGLVGFAGGRLMGLCDVALLVAGQNIEQAEDGHLILNHALCTAIKALDAAGVGTGDSGHE